MPRVGKKTTEPQAGERPWQEVSREVTAFGLAWIDALLAEPDERDRAAAAYSEARARLRESRMPASIDRLSALFRLAPFDEDVLLLLLHAQLSGRPKQVTPQAAQTAFGIQSDEAFAKSWDRLAPDAPLR